MREQSTIIQTHLAGKLPHITVDRHVILQKLYLGKSMAADIANVLLLILCVMSLHVKSEILLTIELFTTFITGVVEV